MNTKKPRRIRAELGPTKRWITCREVKGKTLDRVVLRRDGKDPEVEMHFEDGTFFCVAINLEFKVQLSLHENADDEPEIAMSSVVRLPDSEEPGSPAWELWKDRARAPRKKQAGISTRRR